jgi:hypothetical protein
MGLFRSAMRLFRSGAGKEREEAAADRPEEQTQAGVEVQDEHPQAAGVPDEQTQADEHAQAAEPLDEHAQAAAEVPDEQTRAVKAQPEVAPREVKHEARPNPDKPGWGQSISL